MDLQLAFNQHIQNSCFWSAQEPILVAVSTGSDSMALLNLLQHLPMKLRPKIIVAYVNHQLRAASRQETIFLVQYCQRHQLELFQSSWPLQLHPKNGIEAAARDFRYDFFTKIMQQQQIPILLTAHHGDDQAETILMQWLRSGELSNLVGILPTQPFGNGKLVRPLLPFSKKRLTDYAQQQTLTFFEDETNREDDVLRNRLRHHFVPRLKQENPEFLGHVANFSQALGATSNLAQRWLDQKIQQLVLPDPTQFKWQVGELNGAEQAVLLQRLWPAARPLPFSKASLAADFLNQTDNPHGSLDLAQGWQLVRHYQEFSFSKQPDVSATKGVTETEIPVQLNRWQILTEKRLGLFEVTPAKLSQVLAKLFLPRTGISQLVWRHRQPGDYWRLRSGARQKIARRFVDDKIVLARRDQSWLLANGREIIWSEVLGTSQYFQVSDAESQALVIAQRNEL